jgi:toxin ParE1/3/4
LKRCTGVWPFILAAARLAIGRRIQIGVAPPYIVIYEHDKLRDAVTILRIVHGRRRITGKLLRGA